MTVTGDRDDPGISLVETFVMVAATTAAVRVLGFIQKRRNGIDLSEQQDSAVAVAGLIESNAALQELLTPLRIALMVGPSGENEKTRLVREFDLLHRTGEAAAAANAIHQQLLSLFPTVTVELIEDARVIAQLLSSVKRGGGDVRLVATPVVTRALRFSLDLDQSLVGLDNA